MEGHLKRQISKFFLSLLIVGNLLQLSACATNDKATPDSDTAALESELEEGDTASSSESLDSELEEGAENATPEQAEANQIEEELTLDGEEEPAQAAAPAEKPAEQPVEETPAPVDPVEELAAQPPVVEEVPPQPEVAPTEELAGVDPGTNAESIDSLVNIKNIRFKPENGGSVMIEGDGPLEFTTRSNVETSQFIVEVPNSRLPKKLERPLITKEFKSMIGSINAFQASGSTTTRIVVQLKPGAATPSVSPEDKRLVVSFGGPAATVTSNSSESTPAAEANLNEPNSKILSSRNLQEFLNTNNQFYGKKISVEVSDVDVREVIRLISDESGANLILTEEVKGNVTIKLREVPWDQALVVILKSKKLGYTRSGNVLRIAPITDIRQEETDTVQLINASRTTAPLVVKKIPVSYAKITDIQTQAANFLSERGKVVGDPRTNTIFVSDVADNVTRIAAFIQSIDMPPPQVMIEGKVVEAAETFARSFGIQWGASGRSTRVGSSGGGRTLRMTPGFSIGSGAASSTGGSFNFNFLFGTLDVLGDINAALSLQETQQKVKVLSSPRIVTLHNEAASISQTLQIPLQATTVVAGSPPVTTTTYKDVSLKLDVTPMITNDGSVILDMLINREFVGAKDESGGVPINSRSAKSKVLVKNGQTAVIGGIYQNDTTEGETRVPGLASIPVLGYLFKGKTKNVLKNELLIFVTPRILSQNTEFDDAPLNSANDSISDAPAATESNNSSEEGVDSGLEDEFESGVE